MILRQTLTALLASAALLAAGSTAAQVGRAASEAGNAVEHKIDQKRADSRAKRSGPVGKAANHVKSGYHQNRSQSSAHKAKRALKNAG